MDRKQGNRLLFLLDRDFQLALAVNASLGNGVVYSGPYYARGCPFRQDSLGGPPSPFTFRY